MGKYIVTTFGKWEEQRKQLVAELLNDDAVVLKVTKAKIEQALFDDVNSAMVLAGRAYVMENISKVQSKEMTMRDLTINSYKISLTVVLDALAKALSMDTALLSKSVAKFNQECTNAIDSFIDISMQIADVSIKAKSDAIKQLYGANFPTLYPKLVGNLQLNDPEIIAVARKEIAKAIIPENFGDKAENVRQQLIYIDEVAPQVTVSDEFAKTFQETTGKTMREYKDEVVKNKNAGSVLQARADVAIATPQLEVNRLRF